ETVPVGVRREDVPPLPAQIWDRDVVVAILTRQLLERQAEWRRAAAEKAARANRDIWADSQLYSARSRKSDSSDQEGPPKVKRKKEDTQGEEVIKEEAGQNGVEKQPVQPENEKELQSNPTDQPKRDTSDDIPQSPQKSVSSSASIIMDDKTALDGKAPAKPRRNPKKVNKEDAPKDIEIENKPQESVSDESINSDDKSSKSSHRHGTWEYVPAAPRVAYPKTTDKSDKIAREIAKLAMDVVNSPHDLNVAPEDWYANDAEYDSSRPISMADRIKMGRRREVRQTRPLSPEPMGKKTRKVNGAVKTRARPKKEKKEQKKKEMDKESVDGETEQVTVFLDGSKPHQNGDVSNGIPLTALNHSSPTYSISSTAFSDELGTPFELISEDIRKTKEQQQIFNGAFVPPTETNLSDMMAEEERSTLLSSTYSLPSRDLFPSDLPEDFLEDAMAIDEGVVSKNDGRRLPTEKELNQLEILYNEHGVQYRPRVICVRPITEEISMEELMRICESEDASMVPTRRPTSFDLYTHFGHAAFVYRSVEKAKAMLSKRQIVMDDQCLIVEQPGAVAVQFNICMTGEDEARAKIMSELGPILDIKTTEKGFAVLLPSIDKASELIRARTVNCLTVSSLCSVGRMKWPIIDWEWARELGMEQE
ncbi:hypothetical protein PFISCL1PPCAC_24089, partial [Pristionchus fissidentatus]